MMMLECLRLRSSSGIMAVDKVIKEARELYKELDSLADEPARPKAKAA